MPTFLKPYLGSSLVTGLILGGLAFLVLLVLFILWQFLGAGPRRGRAFRRAQRLLQQGQWQEALNLVTSLQQAGLSASWQGRLRNLEGECHHRAGEEALKERDYESAHQHFQQGAVLLQLNGTELRDRVVETILADARRLIAGNGGRPSEGDLHQAQQLLSRALTLQSPCPEASFWQGLCHFRAGQLEPAMSALTTAHSSGGQRYLDPPLYLGAMLLRQGKPQEALRYLAEANRVDGNCPLVTWQLGMAMVAAEGDNRVAVAALQRALSPRGLGRWTQGRPEKSAPGGPDPALQRVWQEALPETRSFIRRLALKHPYACPVLGSDLGAMVRQGQLSLAQAHYRLGNYQESADLYTKILQEMPPTVPLLRGLGLSLVRLGKYDHAYKHLRTAMEQESPKDPLTAAYLGLCASMGTPAKPEDRPKNVAWAMRLLAAYPRMGDAEWVQIAGLIHAEARKLEVPVPLEDQQRFCEALVSVNAADANAASVIDQFATTSPEAVTPQCAFLYARAAQQVGYRGQRDLELLGQAFRDEPSAKAFFQQRGWDLDDAEYTYLERWAETNPGGFPPELASAGHNRTEGKLLLRSRKLEAAGNAEGALKAADVLLKLSPHSPVGHNRLAQLAYRRGDLNRAAELLGAWHELEPHSPWPLIRRAVVAQQLGNLDGTSRDIEQAMTRTQGKMRAGVAFLGARLALQSALKDGQPSAVDDPNLANAARLLEECLRDDPAHTPALWHLAALRAVVGDHPGMASLVPSMNRPDVADPRFHYLAAACHLAAGDPVRATEAATRAATLASKNAGLASDCHYLLGLALLAQYNTEAAAGAFTRAVETACPSAEPGRAILGKLWFERGAFDEAARWWSQIDAKQRGRWQVEEPLRGAVYLSGLVALRTGEYEKAGEQFREAGKLGLRERNLGGLITLAVFKAGQRLLYEDRV